MEKTKNILVVEDNPGDARLIRELLAEVNKTDFDMACVTRLSNGIERLAGGQFDLVLLDLSLPDSTGLDTFTSLHAEAPEVPIIVLTGHNDEAMALNSVRQGAQDYLVKGEFDGKLLVRSIRYAIERKRAEIALKKSQSRYEKMAHTNARLYERSKQEIRDRIRAEQKLRLTQFTVDHVADNVIWMKPDARLTYVNHATCRTLGYSQAEMLAMTVHDIDVDLSSPEQWQGHFLELQKYGTLTLESHHRRKDGVIFPVEIVMNYIEFDDTELICGIVRDITDRKRLEDKLRHRAENLDQTLTQRTLELTGERIRTRTILEALGEAVFVSDTDRNIQYVNQAAVELTGYDKAELLRQRMRLWRSPRQTSELSTKTLGRIQNGRAWRGEVINQRKDGTLFDAAVTIAPMHDPQDTSRTIGYVSVQRDITALKEAQRVKYRFVSNVSHELRTPLSILTFMADNLFTLYYGLDDEKRRQLVCDIRDHTLGLNDLVTSVLEISRIDSGEIAYTQDRLNLAQIIHEEVGNLRPMAERKGQTLIAGGEDLIWVHGNDGQLRQVIRNLVNNAIKYTPETGTVSCEFRELTGNSADDSTWPESGRLPGGKWAALRVVDNGIGIRTEDLPYIFERFYRVDSQGSIPGAGLGLSIAKELIDLHSGFITVASAPDDGSVFAVYLPVYLE